MTGHVPCPKCGGTSEPMKFTWWGGFLGPKILSHVKCSDCRYAYNGRTGKDNTPGIIIYSVFVGVIVLGLLIVLIAFLVLLISGTK